MTEIPTDGADAANIDIKANRKVKDSVFALLSEDVAIHSKKLRAVDERQGYIS